MTTPASVGSAPALITSASVGDPTTHHRLETLDARLQTLTTPRDVGCVTMIVRRAENGRRECLDRVALTTESGIPGDSWGRRSGASLDSQLTVIQSDVATLIANGQPLPLFGDNLYLDLDLSAGTCRPDRACELARSFSRCRRCRTTAARSSTRASATTRSSSSPGRIPASQPARHLHARGRSR